MTSGTAQHTLAMASPVPAVECWKPKSHSRVSHPAVHPGAGRKRCVPHVRGHGGGGDWGVILTLLAASCSLETLPTRLPHPPCVRGTSNNPSVERDRPQGRLEQASKVQGSDRGALTPVSRRRPHRPAAGAPALPAMPQQEQQPQRPGDPALGLRLRASLGRGYTLRGHVLFLPYLSHGLL